METLGPPTATLLDPATFTPPKPGLSSQDIQLTATGASLGVDDFLGEHEFAGDFKDVPHEESARYAKLGDTLELTVTNTTAGAPSVPSARFLDPADRADPGRRRRRTRGRTASSGTTSTFPRATRFGSASGWTTGR